MSGEITEESVQEKLDKGEELTAEENQFVMGGPATTVDSKDEDAFTEEDEKNLDEEENKNKDKDSEPSEEDKKKEEEKAAADKKAAEEKEKKEKEEAEASKAKEEDEGKVDRTKVETELAKPDTEVSLDGFNKREQGLFWDLRRERKGRQKAEEERDTLKFHELKRKANEEAKKDKKDKDSEKDEVDKIFEGKEDDDYLTVAESKALLKTVRETGKGKTSDSEEYARTAYLKQCDEGAREKFKSAGDYDEVIELTQDIVAKSEAYQKQISEAIGKGENVAVLIYNLIKGDPEFERLLPVARARLKAKGKDKKEDKTKVDSKEIEDKIEANKKKTKTSGNAGGGEDTSGGEEDLQMYANMSDAEFAALPKAKRDAVLKKLG